MQYSPTLRALATHCVDCIGVEFDFYIALDTFVDIAFVCWHCVPAGE